MSPSNVVSTEHCVIIAHVCIVNAQHGFVTAIWCSIIHRDYDVRSPDYCRCDSKVARNCSTICPFARLQNTAGYETGVLKIGLAHTTELTTAQPWRANKEPILSPKDEGTRWFENKTIYKSLVIKDSLGHTGHDYVMYYNAKGDGDFESIGMAVSNDMQSWKRFGADPVISRNKGICGDAQIAKYNDVYVMFYFGAFWKPGAFERFACSYDLINWTDWTGPDLIASSESYDNKYAHKPWVIKADDIVYHFYNAVGDQGRVIALATSKDLTKN